MSQTPAELSEYHYPVLSDNNQQQPTLIKGVAERGKETNTHFFFFADLADPYLPNIVCFPSSNVFFECFLVI